MRHSFAAALLLCLAAPAWLSAQSSFPFQLRIQQDQTILSVTNGTNVNVGVDGPGQSTSLKLTAIYAGTTTVEIISAPQLLGSSDFTVSPLRDLPLTLKPGESLSVDITFRASSSTRATGQLNIGYVEAPARRDLPAVTGAISLGLTGTAPEFAVSYALQTDNNVLPLPDGGKLLFPASVLNSSPVATVIVSNRGSGPGVLTSVRLSGTAFQLAGVPLLPGSVAAGGDVRFAVRYLARRIGSDTGSLEVAFGNRVVKAALEGSTVGSAFTYSILREGSPESPLAVGEPVNLPDTPVGERSSLTFRVRNTGNADGVLNIISTSGLGFGVTDAPFLPVLMAPDDFVTFTLAFAPPQPGRLTGRLRIGPDTFDIAGTGLGALLTLSYRLQETESAVLPGAPILFGSVAVGGTSRVTITVKNTGTRAAPITSVGIGESRNTFQVEGLPALPMTLEPEASFTFAAVFTPPVTGPSTSTLLVNALTFALVGFGNPPPPLPAFRYTGASGTQEPLQQPGIGLSLAAPYPIPLRGLLTLTQDTDALPPDPSVQFVTGGRTVSFTIPANGLAAVFPNASNVIRLQTGTVAGRILINAAFATNAGLDLTPDNPEPLRLAVGPAAPLLLGVQVASLAANGFVLQVSGLAPTRTLTRLNFQLKAGADVKLAGADVVVNVEAMAATWFRSTASQAFGGQFTVAVPFTLRSDAAIAGGNVVEKIERVSVSAANEVGTSGVVTTEIR